jgi:hypothetical protein
MRKISLFVLFIAFCVSSCKKSNPSDPAPVTPPPPTSTIKKFIVDSVISKFLSTPQDIDNGIFKYNSLPGVEKMVKGDFFIEPRDYGYLRKIESVTNSNGEVIVSTTQGTLSEFYQDSGYIKRNFSIPLSENPFAKTAVSLPTMSLSGQGWSLSLENLQFSFDPNWVVEMDVKNKYLKAGFENAQTTLAYDVTLTSDFTGKTEKEFKLSSIFPISKILKLHIPNLFMQIHVVDFIMKITIEGGGKLDSKWHYKNQNVTNAYLEYKNSNLAGVFKSGSPVYEHTKTMNVTGGVNLKVELYPVIRIRDFGIPIINLGVKGIFETEVKQSLIFDTWNLQSQFYGGFYGNFNKTMFQFVAPDEYLIQSSPYVIMQTPKTLNHVSGGDEQAIVNKPLKKPFVFQVFESNKLRDSLPEAFVNVFFSSDYGKWEKTKIRTDINGKVENTFTMGPEEKEHTLTATIKDAANAIIDRKIIKITPAIEPASVSIVSGNNQAASPNTNLANPIIVIVKDVNGQPMPGANVEWAVTAGGGQLTSTTAVTNSNGESSNTWKLGAGGTQTVSVIVKKSDNTNVTGSPLTITAKTYDYIGSWKLASFANGQAPGTLVDEAASGCPNITALKWSLLVDNYTIGATTFTNFSSERIVHYHLGVQNCVVVSDGPDTDITYDETLNGTYTISGNTVTYQTTTGSKTLSLQFLTPDKVKVGENEYIRM